jgi:hypothetical protein
MAAGINFNTGTADQSHFQFKKPNAELWSNVDLTGKGHFLLT